VTHYPLFTNPFSLSLMAWITPTLALCQGRLTGPEWTALSNAARLAGQTAEGLAQEAIDSLVTEIRGRIPRRIQRGADGTIPDEITRAFLALWVYDFITRVPGMKSLLDELRVKAYDNANSTLREMAADKLQIVPPINIAPQIEQAAGPYIEVARPAVPDQMTREQLDGLT
jgi:hypothetical protein